MSKSQASYANLIHTEISLNISLAMHWLILLGFLLLGVLVYKKKLKTDHLFKEKKHLLRMTSSSFSLG